MLFRLSSILASSSFNGFVRSDIVSRMQYSSIVLRNARGGKIDWMISRKYLVP